MKVMLSGPTRPVTARWAALLVAVAAALNSIAPARAQIPPTPVLVSVTPPSGATDVPVTTTVQFTFDVPMDTDTTVGGFPGVFVGAVEWSANVPATDVFYTWSADGRVLTAEFADGLPGRAQIRWDLNKDGALFPLRSAEGVELPKGLYSGSFTTGERSDPGDAPALISAQPEDGATDVPVSTPIVFVFDQPMNPIPVVGLPAPFVGAIRWEGNGVAPANFSCTWSTDARTLTCEYQGDLPGETLVRWTLNPDDGLLALESEEGVPLPEEIYSGSFTTGEGGDPGCDPNPVPTGWGTYGINRHAVYVQNSADDPVPDEDTPFAFMASVVPASGDGGVIEGSVTRPDGGSSELEVLPFGGSAYLFEQFNTEAALDAAFPVGNYTLRFEQEDLPERVVAMSLPAFPPIPVVANFTESQSVNPAADFTLRWNAFTGANPDHDVIDLTITDGADVVFSAPDPCVPRELPVTATSIVIPAGTLGPGKTYRVDLVFGRQGYFSTNTFENMFGSSAVSRLTSLTLRTTGGGEEPLPARFTGYTLLPNGNPELTFTGSPGRAYVVQRSASIVAESWDTMGTVTTDATGEGTFEDPLGAARGPVAFYRAVAEVD